MGQSYHNKKKTPTITEIVEAYNDKEDGSEDFKRAKIGLGTIILGVFILILIYLYFKRKK